MPKKQAVKVVEPVSAEAEATIDKKTAHTLDASINEKIRTSQEHLAVAYLDLAASLREMNETKGYLHLRAPDGTYFSKWEDYLSSKNEFGRTYLSYLYKLGQAGDLQKYLEQGITASKFIEFAKRTDFPEKIPQLIEATWEEVKDKPVRETAKMLDQYVDAHRDEFKKPKRQTGAGRSKMTWKERFQSQYEKLSADEQADFLKQLRAFVKEVGQK